MNTSFRLITCSFMTMLITCICQSGWAATPYKTYGKQHGTTTISVPATLFNVRLDNKGNLTGNGSTVSVEHKDPGTFCKKVDSVTVILGGKYYSQAAYHHASPSRREMNLCNFNRSDARFEFILPGINVPSQRTEVAAKWSAECKASGRNGVTLTTKHPFFNEFMKVDMWYKNHDSYYALYNVPPVILTCDPCPALTVRDSVQLQPDAMTTIMLSSLVSGGIPPYNVRFSRIPTGLVQQGTALTGRPAAGSYRGTITVEDSCKSANNRIEKNFEFQIRDSTPPVIRNTAVTPATVATQGGAVLCQLTATDNKGVASANAYITGPGFTITLPLAKTAGTPQSGTWQATYRAPANRTAQDINYKVDFRATDTDGNNSPVTGAAKSFTVSKDRVIPSFAGIKVTPAMLAGHGGSITASAVIRDDSAVQSAVMYLTRPDGSRTASRLSMTSGTAQNGEWKLTWNMPANNTGSMLRYAIQVAATDTAGNTATSQPVTFIVQPRTVTPGTPTAPKHPNVHQIRKF
ncbi:MAG TPA: hypothetical protein PL053_05750 [Deltaproteobacteria bacterium]|nr:hypothetical protein [Deltaproteobacteria bacterium]